MRVSGHRVLQGVERERCAGARFPGAGFRSDRDGEAGAAQAPHTRPTRGLAAPSPRRGPDGTGHRNRSAWWRTATMSLTRQEAQQDQGEDRSRRASRVNDPTVKARRSQHQQFPEALAAVAQPREAEAADRCRPGRRVQGARQDGQRYTSRRGHDVAERLRQTGTHDHGERDHTKEAGDMETPAASEGIGVPANAHNWTGNHTHPRPRPL